MRFTARLRCASSTRASPSGDGNGNGKENECTCGGEDEDEDSEDILASLVGVAQESEPQREALLAKILSSEGFNFNFGSCRDTGLPEDVVQANTAFFRSFKAKLPKRAMVRKSPAIKREAKQVVRETLLPSREKLRSAKLVQVTRAALEELSRRVVDVHYSAGFNKNGAGALKRIRERYLSQAQSCPFAQADADVRVPHGAVHCVVPTASALDCFKDAFHEVFKAEEHGFRFLILGSVLDQLEAQGFRRTLAWVVELLKRRVESVFFFCNQFHNATRKVLQALQWMRIHGKEHQLRLTVLSSNEDFLKILSAETFHALTPQQFFRTHFSSPRLLRVVDSLALTQTRLGADGSSREGMKDGDYEAHWSKQKVSDGLHRGEVVKGVLRVDGRSKGCQDAWVGDVLVSGEVARNRAVENDIVAVLPKSVNGLSSSSRTGMVVAVINARWRPYVATLSAGDVEAMETNVAKSDAVVVPMDKRIPKIHMSFSNPSALIGQRFVVAIDEWPLESRHPRGHYLKTLGPIGDLTTEGAAILVENGLEGHMNAFSSGALRTLPFKNWTVPSEALQTYRDLRDLVVFSVDPVVCQDIDDALSCKTLGENKYEIGVHIADVTSFVESGSSLDREAARRCTSVYLQDRRLDMLPRLLCEDLCSLRPNVDRLAVSVIWEIAVVEDRLQVESCWYGRTVINSVHALSYSQAQRLADGQDPGMEAKKHRNRSYTGRFVPNEIRDKLRSSLGGLMRIARLRKKGRASNGALDLSGDDEFGFSLDASSLPTEVDVHDHLEVHSTIEELMIFANETVAKEIYKKFPTAALLRRHTKPEAAKLKEVVSFVEKLELHVPFKTESNAAIAKSMRTARTILNTQKYSLLNDLLKRRIAEAEYFCTAGVHPNDFMHFGLGLEFYTHFTSPIRRYADVVVHRLLLLDKDANQSHVDHVGVQPSVGVSLPRSQVPSLLTTGGADSRGGKHSALLRAYGVTQSSSSPEPLSRKREKLSIVLGKPRAADAEDDLDQLLTQDASEQAWNSAVGETSNVDDDLDDLLFEDTQPPTKDMDLDDLLGGPPASVDDDLTTPSSLDFPAAKPIGSDNVASTSEELSEQCAQINRRHRAAKSASRASQDLYLSLLFFRSPQAVQAVVVDVIDARTNGSHGDGISVFIPAYQMKLRLHFTGNHADTLFVASGVGDALIDVGAASCNHPNDHTVEVSSQRLSRLVLKQLGTIYVWISCADARSLDNYARFPRPVAHLLSPDAPKPALTPTHDSMQHSVDILSQAKEKEQAREKENAHSANSDMKPSGSFYASMCSLSEMDEEMGCGVGNKVRVRERSGKGLGSSRGKKWARVTKTKGRVSFGFLRRTAAVQGTGTGTSSRGNKGDSGVKLTEAEVRRKTLEVTRRTQRLAKVKRDDRIKRRKRQQ